MARGRKPKPITGQEINHDAQRTLTNNNNNNNSQSDAVISAAYRAILPKDTKIDNLEPHVEQPQVPDTFFYQPLTPETLVQQQRSLCRRSVPRSCRVGACVIPNCNLRTHRSYPGVYIQANESNSLSRSFGRKCPHQESGAQPAGKQKPNLDFSIIRGGVDGLPALPLDGLHEPVFREMFHRFFSYYYDKIYAIVVPPPISKTQQRIAAQAKHTALSVALSVPAFCLNCIAATYLQIAYAAETQYLDKTTTILHGKITSSLRDKIDSVTFQDAVELIHLIFTLVMYETSFDRAYTLPFHRRAVDHVVASQGGIHNMGDAIPCIHNLDRTISIFTDLPPSHAPKVDRNIRRPIQYPSTYGTFFESSSSNVVDSTVRDYCFDSCRAIELVENLRWTFNPIDISARGITDIHYLYYLRDCVVNQYVHLNAAMAERRDVSRCILVTTRIIDYVVLQDNYLMMIPVHLASKVGGFISDVTAFPACWEGFTDVLLWILFVLTSIPDPWNGRSWAMTMLECQLNLKYSHKEWPANWRERELENVRAFVWSDTRLNTNFRRTCNELVHSGSALKCLSAE